MQLPRDGYLGRRKKEERKEKNNNNNKREHLVKARWKKFQ